LIVNADDFGLTDGINRAVVDLPNAGALPSATLMAASPSFKKAAVMASQQSTLGVGCHVVLVDGFPMADPAAIPTLLSSGKGQPTFRATLGEFVRDLYLGRIALAHMELESTAQIRHLQQAGVLVTHVDTHKHTHMFPAVLGAVTRAAIACGIQAVRNPFEPAWSVAATPEAGAVRSLQVRLLRRFQKDFQKIVGMHSLFTTDGCAGVLATGTLNEATLRALLHRLPQGTWELVCHPAYMDEELRATRTRLQQSRQIELEALHFLPKLASACEIELVHFGQLR